MRRFVLIGLVVLACLILLVLLAWFGGDRPPTTVTTEPLYFRHPMNPSITSPVPAKDDMGMDYIPVYEDDSKPNDALVRISPAMEQNLGVRTAPVLRAPLAQEINTVGHVAFDERLLSHVDLRVTGWIEDLQVRTLGQTVKRGDLLFRLYSRELDIAQREYLQTTRDADMRLHEAGTERLKALGMAPEDIQKLERTRQPLELLPIYARQDGIVAELNAREGMFVSPGTTVMTLAGLERVWILVDVFEQQADSVKVGQVAEVRLPHKPHEVWKGEVDFIYPQLDPKTRTLKARLIFPNYAKTFRPNMYADVTVLAGGGAPTLSVPSEAVIRTGDGARVIVARGRGRFDPVSVKVGIEAGDRIEILDGLAAGDHVVVAAQFLLDSEASLEASLRRMAATEIGEADASEGIWIEGVVNGVGETPSSVSLSHDAVPELDRPAMTMDFSVSDDVDLDTMTPGQPLRFRLSEGEDGHVITDFETVERATVDQVVAGTGTLNRINAEARSVNLSHEPIPALHWPAMTMDFKLDEDMPLPSIELGRAVRFQLQKSDEGLVVIQLEPAE